MKLRPQTPLVSLMNSSMSNLENENEKQNKNDYYLKNFSNFMKQVIDKKNENFLSGNKNLVKYILSKYLNIPEDDLDKLKKLSILISNDYGLLNQFGSFLPELKLLKLNNSNILNFNDIGTNFNKIECLQMKRCHLRDLNGIICMQNLKILDIEDNEVSDLIDLDMCSELKKIILKKNKILESDNLQFLSSLINLEYIDIRDNPICESDDIEENIQNNLNEVKIVIWKNEKNNNIIDVVQEYNDNLYDSTHFSSSKSIVNKSEKEINEIMNNNDNENEEENEENENENESNKQKNSFSPIKNNLMKKTKIQIDAGQEKSIINNNKNIKINQGSFRQVVVKKQPLKPIKLNKGEINVDKSNESNYSVTTSSGTTSSKEKPSSAFKIENKKESDKPLKINPLKQIKITKK